MISPRRKLHLITNDYTMSTTEFFRNTIPNRQVGRVWIDNLLLFITGNQELTVENMPLVIHPSIHPSLLPVIPLDASAGAWGESVHQLDMFTDIKSPLYLLQHQLCCDHYDLDPVATMDIIEASEYAKYLLNVNMGEPNNQFAKRLEDIYDRDVRLLHHSTAYEDRLAGYALRHYEETRIKYGDITL